MTLQEKIDRYRRELAELAGGRPTRDPLIGRLLWGLHLDVPPPLLWPLWAWFLLLFVTSMTAIYAMSVLPWTRFHVEPIHTVVIVAALSFSMAWGRVQFNRRLPLSPWYAGPGGDA